jgi:protein SCO1/2
VTRAILLGLAVAVLAGCGAHHAAGTATATTPTAGFAIDPPVAAPSFVLRDQDGRRVGPQLDRGHWTIVTFLYTHCPDVCPLIADNLSAAQRADRDLHVIAVSVDPVRDTPGAVRRFLAAHRAGPRFRYATGTKRDLARVWRSYHIAALPGPAATVGHTALSVLVDPRGRERILFDSAVTARQMLRAIARSPA